MKQFDIVIENDDMRKTINQIVPIALAHLGQSGLLWSLEQPCDQFLTLKWTTRQDFILLVTYFTIFDKNFFYSQNVR